MLDEVSVKVLPAPDQTRTLLLHGLADDAAVTAMCAAMGSPHEVSGAAHVGDRTALRIEGVAPSVEARLKGLRELLATSGATMDELGTLESRAFWREVRDVAPLERGADAVVWRISCPPTEGPAHRRAHQGAAARRPKAFYDWSGGLIWLALPPSADADHAIVRGALGPTGGHATLIRAPETVRAAVPVFQPQPAALAALAARVKESFDPKRPLQSGADGLDDANQLHPGPARRSGDRAQRAHPAQVRALRLLHRDLPDLRAAGRRARQPARAHLLHQGDARGRSRADGVRRSGTSIAACRACPA